MGIMLTPDSAIQQLPAREDWHPKSAMAYTALAIIVLLAVSFRFAGNDRKLFWFDEIASVKWSSAQDIEHSLLERAGRPLAPSEVRELLAVNVEGGVRAVVESVIRDDPQHGPLFYILLNRWALIMGDSLSDLRAFPALAGLLLLPCLYFFCRQLGCARLSAWIAVALVAISPFHIVYAQEIRQYTLWLLIVVLASMALIWALKTRGCLRWGLYGLLVAIGLYVHLLFCFVVAAHAGYVVGCFFARTARNNRATARQDVLAYSLSTAFGMLLFSPWIWVVLTHLSTAVDHLSWSSSEVDLSHLLAMWGYNYSAVFLDTGQALKYLSDPDWTIYLIFLLRAVLLVPPMLAVIWLLRSPKHDLSLFLLPLILVPFLGLAIPDLLLGGMRSGGGNRFLAPSYLGLQIALATWIGSQLSGSSESPKPKAAGTILVIYLVMGAYSGLVFVNSDTWWNKTIGHFNMEAAKTINIEEQPLVILGSKTDLLSLAFAADDHVTLVLHSGEFTPDARADYNAVFYLDPPESIIAALEGESTQRLKPANTPSRLYRLHTPQVPDACESQSAVDQCITEPEAL
jgi:uncharacterized membrane protein